jgi:hypothetical protein
MNTQGGIAGYPPSPYIVNLIELQNTINNASGLTTTSALSNAITDIQKMVDFQKKQINTNFLASYDSNSITVLSNMNFSNATLTVEGTSISGTGSANGTTFLSTGNTSIVLSATSSPAIAFNIQKRPIFTFTQSTNALYFDPSGIASQFQISSATLVADRISFRGQTMSPASGKYLASVDTLGNGIWSYVSSLQTANTNVRVSAIDNTIRFTNNNVQNGMFSVSSFSVLPQAYFTSNVNCSQDVYAANFFNISDSNFKKNIQTLDSVYTDSIIKNLQGVRFTWNRDDSSDIGLIAQAVREVLPEAVKETEEGLTVAYTKIVPLLIESVKGLKVRVNDLEKQIEQIKSRLPPL